ncbi:MAG: acylphosphatase [Bacteroidales bacterium]|nr:acylphosphatase [Bacteroidales bacterium]
MRAVAIKITGIVQGVGFRYYVYSVARELHVCGFVRNCSDGEVYVEAQGSDSNILLFVDACRRGSPHSDVRNVDVAEIDPKGLTSFEILA